MNGILTFLIGITVGVGLTLWSVIVWEADSVADKEEDDDKCD